jgi:hypothetical protein
MAEDCPYSYAMEVHIGHIPLLLTNQSPDLIPELRNLLRKIYGLLTKYRHSLNPLPLPPILT